MSLRRVRSPEAPKMTMAQGSGVRSRRIPVRSGFSTAATAKLRSRDVPAKADIASARFDARPAQPVSMFLAACRSGQAGIARGVQSSHVKTTSDQKTPSPQEEEPQRVVLPFASPSNPTSAKSHRPHGRRKVLDEQS